MDITLNDLGKKYNRQWIFRHLNTTVKSGEITAITGHNGAGKSTLLKIISGFTTPSEGSVDYSHKADDIQTQFSFAAPYLNLMDEFTLLEHLHFHGKFKKPQLPYDEMIARSGLTTASHKLVKDFSSGMRQRLRLSLAFFFESAVIFLDEPTSNLDEKGVAWYQELITSSPHSPTIVIASNQPQEYQSAHQIISIEPFKA